MTKPQPKILVTGASGFVGSQTLQRVPTAMAFNDEDGIVDLTDAARVLQALERLEFSAVLHLAGETFVPSSFRDPGRTFQVNVVGSVNLLAALSQIGFPGRLIYVSSGEVYGAVPEELLPVTESHSIRPGNPYATSKVAAEVACEYWRRKAGLDIVIARPFNHIGAGQDRRFAVADFAHQLIRVKEGQVPPLLNVGNIDATRDFSDVRDIIDGYLALIGHAGAHGAYNICSGTERSLRELIELMAAYLEVEVEITVDPTRLRQGEQLRMRGSFERLERDTGWRPCNSIESSLEAILEYELRNYPA